MLSFKWKLHILPQDSRSFNYILSYKVLGCYLAQYCGKDIFALQFISMDHLSQIRINFDQGQVTLLNLCLGFLMFGVSLDLRLSDFGYLLKNSKSVIAGLVSQLILLPLLTMILVFILKPAPSLVLGMLLIASCPGGNVSNYAVHLARANVALSVVLTSISTLACTLTTPLIFSIGKYVAGSTGSTPDTFSISFVDMAIAIVKLLLFPLILGLLFNRYLPVITRRIQGAVKVLSFVIFICFVLFAILGNLNNMQQYLGNVFFIVLIHNGLALLVGYLFSYYAAGLNSNDSISIAIETGIQNSGLALVLIFNFFGGEGGMALIAAWWSIWHLLSAFGLALGRNYSLKRTIASDY